MNDSVLLPVVAILLGAYVAVVIVENALKLRDWFRARKLVSRADTDAIAEMIQAGTIPRDYSRIMKAAMEQVNAQQIATTDGNSIYPTTEAIIRFETLKGMRTRVARVRHSGYLRGERDRHSGVKFSQGIAANPYKKGTGAAQQWVRGYCAGQNVMDIAVYYNEA